jgi:hypothetical protein
LASVEPLLCTDIVVTEKLDGSNVCIEADGCYARSHASAPNHPSFDAFKAFHAGVKSKLPDGLQVFGEWLYARHSIGYSTLPGYFMAFGVRDLKKMTWASWAEVELWAEELSVQTAPVLAKESWLNREWKLRDLTESLSRLPSCCGGEREGVVVRRADEFADKDFSVSVAKLVRANHVQTEDHWKNQAIVRNLLGT